MTSAISCSHHLCRLKGSQTRATDIFKGAYKAWIDNAGKHIAKSVAFEGVLAPVSEDIDGGVGGCGFLLWADKSLTPAYAFTWTCDFKIPVSE